jgi:hypothetical protein
MLARFLASLVTVVLVSMPGAFSGSTACAQAWEPPGPAVSVAPPPPEEPVHTHHEVRTKLLVSGVTMLASSYVASIVWGSIYLATLDLGVLSCNDQYAGWHFVPVVGPVVGMFAGGGCIPDGLHAEEAIMPVVFSALQFAGMMMTIFGALGNDVPDAPSFALSIDRDGAFGSLRGTF